LTFWGLVLMHSSWWRNKLYQIIARLCPRWIFGGITHHARDGMFAPDNEWGYDGACVFILTKQVFTTLANPRRVVGFDES
jgi:hypothetical protein